MWQKQSLHQQLLTQNIVDTKMDYSDVGLNLTGQALVFYQVSHPDYPSLTIQRLYLRHDITHFYFEARGIRGSLTSYFQKTEPYTVKRQILSYSPHSDLLKLPLITLATLGYDQINLDIKLTATLIAANQISCDLFLIENGHIQAHFTTRFKPQDQHRSVFENLVLQNPPMRLSYLDNNLKERLDDYCLSKNLPFVTDGQQFPFSVLQK